MFRRIEIVTPYLPDGCWRPNSFEIHGTPLSPGSVACKSMVESGLPDPNKHGYQIRIGLDGRRIRFFFTERGWRQCGHKVLAEIRSYNLQARVIAIKEKDPRIEIIYRDVWQIVAIFSPRRNRNGKRSNSREGGPRAK